MDISALPDTGNWFATQRKYWDAWVGLARSMSGGEIAEKPQTESAWENLARAYLGFAERVASTGAGDVTAAFEKWRDGVTRMFPLPVECLHPVQSPGPERIAQDMRKGLDRFLAIPAVGYSREAQEQYQKFTRLVLEYLRALQDYTAGFAGVGMRTADAFREKVNESSKTAPVDSMRKLYDLWVDAGEEVYSEHVTSEEYTARYGRLVNALMAVKGQGSMFADEVLEALRIPTRGEMNGIHQRLQETRRDNLALRAALERLQQQLKDEPVKERPTKEEPTEEEPRTLARRARPASKRRRSH